MANDNSLKELIVNSQQEEAQQKYDENVNPMKADIDEFVEKLKSYCLKNKTLEVRIIYRAKNESVFGFFGTPVRGNQVIISGWFHTEIEEAWIKLLTKWYFTKNGGYLISAVRNIAFENGFSSKYDDEGGWGWMKDMIQFTVK